MCLISATLISLHLYILRILNIKFELTQAKGSSLISHTGDPSWAGQVWMMKTWDRAGLNLPQPVYQTRPIDIPRVIVSDPNMDKKIMNKKKRVETTQTVIMMLSMFTTTGHVLSNGCALDQRSQLQSFLVTLYFHCHSQISCTYA